MDADGVKKLIRQQSKGLTAQKEEDLILKARISNLRRYDGEQIQMYNQDMLNRMGDSVVRISKDPDLGQYLSRDTERQYGDEYWIESNAIEALKMITTGDLAGQIAEQLTRAEQTYLISNIKSIYDEVKRAGKGKASVGYVIALIKSKYASFVNPIITASNLRPPANGDEGASQISSILGEDLNDGLNDDFGVDNFEPDEPEGKTDWERNPMRGGQTFGDEIVAILRTHSKNEDNGLIGEYIRANKDRYRELTVSDYEAIFTEATFKRFKRGEFLSFAWDLGAIQSKSMGKTEAFETIKRRINEMRGMRRTEPSLPLFDLNDEPPMPKGYGDEFSALTSAEDISGKGLSFQKRMPFHYRNHIVGRGLNEMPIPPPRNKSKTRDHRKYYDKVYIDMARLEKGVLFCKYISYNQPIPTLKTQQISNDCRDVIKDIINDKFNMKVFNLLTKPERRLIRNFATKFNYELEIDNDNEDEQFQQQFQVLLGQYEAGNNDEKVKTQLKSYVRLAIKEDLIPYREGLALLVELA